MADVDYVFNEAAAPGASSLFWEGLTSALDAEAYRVPALRGAMGSMQASGDIGTDAVITLHGSNDGTNFVALNDRNGDPIALSALGIIDFDTAALWIKPVVTAGTAEDLDVTVVLRG